MSVLSPFRDISINLVEFKQGWNGDIFIFYVYNADTYVNFQLLDREQLRPHLDQNRTKFEAEYTNLKRFRPTLTHRAHGAPPA